MIYTIIMFNSIITHLDFHVETVNYMAKCSGQSPHVMYDIPTCNVRGNVAYGNGDFGELLMT